MMGRRTTSIVVVVAVCARDYRAGITGAGRARRGTHAYIRLSCGRATRAHSVRACTSAICVAAVRGACVRVCGVVLTGACHKTPVQETPPSRVASIAFAYSVRSDARRRASRGHRSVNHLSDTERRTANGVHAYAYGTRTTEPSTMHVAKRIEWQGGERVWRYVLYALCTPFLAKIYRSNVKRICSGLGTGTDGDEELDSIFDLCDRVAHDEYGTRDSVMHFAGKNCANIVGYLFDF